MVRPSLCAPSGSGLQISPIEEIQLGGQACEYDGGGNGENTVFCLIGLQSNGIER